MTEHDAQIAVLVDAEPPVAAVRHCQPLADMPTDLGYLVFLAVRTEGWGVPPLLQPRKSAGHSGCPWARVSEFDPNGPQ